MEAVRTSEMSVNVNWSTRCYIPEDSKLHNLRHENLKSHKEYLVCSNRGAIALGGRRSRRIIDHSTTTFSVGGFRSFVRSLRGSLYVSLHIPYTNRHYKYIHDTRAYRALNTEYVGDVRLTVQSPFSNVCDIYESAIYEFHMILRVNSNYFPIRSFTCLCNGGVIFI
jgi:hypothetical protein